MSRRVPSSPWVVLAHHGLGDLVMALPLLRACDAVRPQGTDLVVVVKSSVESEVLSLVDWRRPVRALALPRRSAAAILAFAAALRRERPALLLAPHATQGAGAAALSRLVGAARSIGPAGPWARIAFDAVVERRSGEHKVLHYLRFAERAGLPTLEVPPESAPAFEDRSAAPAARPTIRRRFEDWLRGEPRIVFAPGSGDAEAHKRWPAESFRALGERLLERFPRARIAAFGSPAESELLQAALGGRGGVDSRAVTVALPSVVDGFALLRESDVVVAGCSGAAHLAALAGRPIVGLFGPTNPAFTGPFAGDLRVVRQGLRCSPCYRVGFIRGCGRPVCMTGIRVDDVFHAVCETIAGRAAPPVPWCETTGATAPSEPDVPAGSRRAA
jgi:ADP-heptose:LPS heptosyltransferase